MEDNAEVVDTTETASTTPEAAFAQEVGAQGQFTAEDIAKARAQEKAKLYPQIEKMSEELAETRKILEEQKAKEADRAAKRAEREAARAQEKKRQEEDEMSFKQLLAVKEQELQAQLEIERAEREKAFALLEREREFQELSNYRQHRLEQERDNIMPELLDLITGNTKDEIEQSILGLKDRTAKILDSVKSATQQSKKDLVGARVTAPASGPLDNDSESNITPNDISKMSMADYIKNREKLLRSSSNNRGQGLFG